MGTVVIPAQGYIRLCVRRNIFGDSSSYLRLGVSRKILWDSSSYLRPGVSRKIFFGIVDVKYALRLTPKFWR